VLTGMWNSDPPGWHLVIKANILNYIYKDIYSLW
jgi:hypothetical protein